MILPRITMEEVEIGGKKANSSVKRTKSLEKGNVLDFTLNLTQNILLTI